MIDAFVLYGTPEKPNRQVFEMGLALFDDLGIHDYQIHRHKLNRLGYGVNREVDKQTLIDAFDKDIFNFEISRNMNGRLVYFSQSIRTISAFNTVKFGGFLTSELSDKGSQEYIAQIVNNIYCRYGFSFQAANPFKAINYIHDVGGIAMSQYDAPSKWQRKFMYSKDDTEYSNRFRLVYENNVLSQQHLATEIEGKSLFDWITEKPERGVLTKLNGDMWLWSVKSEYLDDINYACGHAGILVSFIEPSKNLIRRHQL